MLLHVPGLLTSSIPAMVMPRKMSRESRRPAAGRADVRGGLEASAGGASVVLIESSASESGEQRHYTAEGTEWKRIWQNTWLRQVGRACDLAGGRRTAQFADEGGALEPLELEPDRRDVLLHGRQAPLLQPAAGFGLRGECLPEPDDGLDDGPQRETRREAEGGDADDYEGQERDHEFLVHTSLEHRGFTDGPSRRRP